jgi:hypothetical protein
MQDSRRRPLTSKNFVLNPRLVTFYKDDMLPFFLRIISGELDSEGEAGGLFLNQETMNPRVRMSPTGI